MTTAHIERIDLDALTAWRIRRGAHELVITQQGAQVLSYRQGDQPPLIWLSEQAAYARGQSVRGGIPICWPWFGALERNPHAVQALHGSPSSASAHGGVRGLDWQLLGIDNQDDAVIIQFALDTREQPLPDWPHDARLNLCVRLDERLHLSLCTDNLGQHPLPFSQALHSYFAVSDIRHVHVEGLAGCRYVETLEGWQQRDQRSELRFTGETDRIYLDTPPALSIVDPLWQRRLHLHSSGSRSAVLWNPWIDKAQRLSQFADDAWTGMLCIEHANVLDDCISLAPGEQYRLEVSMWSESLAE